MDLADERPPDYGPNRLQGGLAQDKVESGAFTLPAGDDDFITTLDAKLKSLEEETEAAKKKRKKQRSTSLETRPMFITTVKTGIFLEPPPELAALLGYSSSYNVSSGSTASHKSGEDLVYSFSSQPRVLNNTRPKPKVSNERMQQVNMEKMKNKTVRAKRDVGNSIANNNTTVNNSTSVNNSTTVNNNAKNKKENNNIQYGNIMYDRRVVRGPTFMHHPVPTQTAESQAARQAEARRRSMARRRAQSQRVRNLRLRMGTPPPVEGRKHQHLQTQEYLEDLFDNPPEVDMAVQTDVFLDRPPTPLHTELIQLGVDVGTQIYPGELFHFDVEVRPVLEVLVGKTIEQSLIEVFEEDETAAIRRQQELIRERRDSELAEEQRLAEKEARKQEQIRDRIMEHKEAMIAQRETEDRVAAAVLTTGYIADLLPSVLKGLKDGGYLFDDVQEDVDGKFMEWLMLEVKTELQKMVENRDLLTEMIREIIETRAKVYRDLGEHAAHKRGHDSEEDVTPSEQSLVVPEEEEEYAGEEGMWKPQEQGNLPAEKPDNPVSITDSMLERA